MIKNKIIIIGRNKAKIKSSTPMSGTPFRKGVPLASQFPFPKEICTHRPMKKVKFQA